MTKPHALSVCMIVKNEGELLDRCLESVRAAADQIVVVDTGSSDSTVDIARGHGATLVLETWRDDFAWARNISLEHASCAWILWLDADDIVPAESIPRLIELKQREPDRVYGMVVRNERPGGTGSEFVQARIFPNRPDIRFEGKIHEQMMPSALRLGMKMENSGIVVEHHGYADPLTLKAKARRNIRLLLDEYNTMGPDPVLAVEIADSYRLTEDLDSAAQWYRTVLSIHDTDSMPAIAGQAHLGLGTILNGQGDHTGAIVHLQRALSLSPWRADVVYGLGVAQELDGDIEAALGSFRRILAMEDAPGQVGVDFRAARIKARLRLLRVLAEQGRVDDACAEAARAVEAHGDRPEILNMAAKVRAVAGQFIEALRLFERSLKITTQGNLDAYAGLCAIYARVGKGDVARVTITSIEPLFASSPRYWALRRLFTLQSEECPFGTTESLLEKEREALQREFLGLINSQKQ